MEPLWMPDEARVRGARITDYRSWLAGERGLCFADYEALRQWSTTDPGAFWRPEPGRVLINRDRSHSPTDGSLFRSAPGNRESTARCHTDRRLAS